MKKLKFKIDINTLNYKNLNKEVVSNNKINLINVNYSQRSTKKFHIDQIIILKILLKSHLILLMLELVQN